MKTSILICATCLIVTGCSAQLRFPSLSSALSSLTGFGGSNSASSSNSQSGQSSPYSGLIRDYGRNLMMAMSSIYPTVFKPPQSQQAQQQQPQSQAAPQSPFDQTFSASQYGSQSLFPSQSAPSFSFGGSTFSISPSLPFGSLTGGSQAQNPSASGSHSPFGASFGSSINSPSSFGPLSSAPFLQQSVPSYAPASSYNAAFEAANGGPSIGSSYGSLGAPSGLHSPSSPMSSQSLMPQSSNTNQINSYAPLPSYSSQHDSSSQMVGQNQHQSQQNPLSQQAGLGAHPSASFAGQQHSQPGQFAPQQYRPDMMSIAASAPVPSSNSYSNYASIPSGPSSQQAPSAPSSYQQPSFR